MTRFLFAIILIVGSHLSSAQSIVMSYNDVHIGRNLSLSYQTDPRSLQWYIGIKYHLNSSTHDSQPRRFQKRFYASSFSESIGLQLGLNYCLFSTSHSSLSIFYEAQVTRAGTRGDFVEVIGIVDSITFYSKSVQSFSILNALEHHVGISVQVDLYQHLFVTYKLGLGATFFWDIPEATEGGISYGGPPQLWQRAHIISAGIGYRFKR